MAITADIFGCQHWTINGMNCASCGAIIPQRYRDELITSAVINQFTEPTVNLYGTELSKNELDMLLDVFRTRYNEYKPHRKYH